MAKIPEIDNNFKGIKVVCIGDSLTYGTTIIKRKRDCYPSRLQRILGNEFEVVNMGFSGHTVNPYCEKRWASIEAIEFLENYQPNYIVFMLGTNDSRIHNWTDSKTFEKEYNRLINYFKSLKSSPTLIVMTSPQVFTNNKLVDINLLLLNKIVDMQRKIAKENNVYLIDINEMTKERYDLYSPDLVHFNSKGAKFLSFNVYYKIIEDLRIKNKKYKDRLFDTSINCKK